jgi:type IV pilus assembly protein PilO
MAINLSMSKLPWYGPAVLFTALGLGAIGAFYYLYQSPMNAEMAVREETLATLRANISKGMSTATKLPEFRAQVADLEARLDSLKAVLPEQKDVAELLRRIQTLATQSNLTIRGFKPMPTATKELHAEWPIQLQLDGTYHNLGMFFDRISRFSRIINVGDVEIRAKDRPEPDSSVTARCTATTFVLLEQKPEAPGAAGAKTAPGGPK